MYVCKDDPRFQELSVDSSISISHANKRKIYSNRKEFSRSEKPEKPAMELAMLADMIYMDLHDHLHKFAFAPGPCTFFAGTASCCSDIYLTGQNDGQNTVRFWQMEMPM